MATSLVTEIESRSFITKLQKLVFSSSDDYSDIEISCDGITVLSERYVPDADGNITLYDIAALLTPYLIASLVSNVSISWTTAGSPVASPTTFKAIYTSAVIQETSYDFYTTHFLTHCAEKVTALGRKEVLYFYVDMPTTPRCTAYYTDGTSTTQDYPQPFSDVDTIAMLEVSANNFVAQGKTLTGYRIGAGSRVMDFTVTPAVPTAPALLFRNSFGCEETIYCVGTQQLDPKYTYTAAAVEDKYRNVGVEEVKNFAAYTGVLTVAMSNWADDLFRSTSIYLFTVNQQTGVLTRGREVTITEAKSLRSNDADFLPNFYFEYRYSQNNHNIFDKTVAGRIFDDTFDYTFE